MKNIKGLALGLGVVAAGALSVSAVAGGATLANHDITLTAASAADITAGVTAFDPTLAEAFHATAAEVVKGQPVSTPLTTDQLSELAAAFNSANGSGDNQLADLSGTTLGTGENAVEYYGFVNGAGDGTGTETGAQDPSAYLYTLDKDGNLAANTDFKAGDLSANDLGNFEHSQLGDIWSQLNTGDTTGFSDIQTYYGGIASQLPEIAALMANPWYVFGQSYETVMDDFMGKNGGEFADLFSNSANLNDAGDLTVMFTDLNDALGLNSLF
ncbi:hypothetical protein KIH27_02665 [Mycobacterium sp. M1]|uniref:Uncharacterized protein n=1 Tax=Mycolicibacter acidiphilus TaxID=2835306 RepID=A0ABS5RDX6_9MYCO|nr:hypothetical protein [Mycolicibacter acidiphilus]MBS9532486.1 hypothetical protein [Mycolicibacter acidiphilus]